MGSETLSCTSVFTLLFFYSTFVNARLGGKSPIWETFGSPITRNAVESSGYRAAMNIPGNVIITVPAGESSIKAFQQEDNGVWNQLGNTLTQSASLLALSADGRTVILGNGGVPGGIVKVFALSGNNVWQQMGAAITGDSTPTSSDATGSAIAISNDGKTIAVGSQGYDNGCGKVEVYDFGTQWKIRGGAIECWDNTQKVGSKLSLSGAGDKLLIFDRVYQWVTSSASWEQLGPDISGMPSSKIYREALSNDGKVVAMASPYSEESSEGIVVHTYSLNEAGTEWGQLGNTISQLLLGGKLTYMSLNALGNTLLVSWPYWRSESNADNPGLARVFELAADEWKQIGQSFPGQVPFAYMGSNIGIDYDGNRIFLSWLNNTDTQREGLFQVYVKSS